MSFSLRKPKTNPEQRLAPMGVNWRTGSVALEKAIQDQQEQQGWGAKIIDRLAQDLRTNFPEMKGFSPAW